MQPVEKKGHKKKMSIFPQSFLSRDLSRNIICVFYAT